MIEDITGLKRAEQELNESLQEKEHLMRELNHRVKNNLHLVHSLINLKASQLGDDVDLSDIRHQVHAFEIIHEKLSRTESFAFVNIHDYIQDILTGIFSSYSDLDVHIEDTVEELELPTKTALTLGLITNEIATNAVKYGFSSREEAIFSVSFFEDEEKKQYVYVLSNSGNPFPDDIDMNNTDTIGLQLISTLAAQLGGTLDLEKRPNPVFTLRFPAETG
jgi:two-component sensor histidine kinase